MPPKHLDAWVIKLIRPDQFLRDRFHRRELVCERVVLARYRSGQQDADKRESRHVVHAATFMGPALQPPENVSSRKPDRILTSSTVQSVASV